jgi:uncharacterized protein Yka (UPF0111/DUF47 family)
VPQFARKFSLQQLFGKGDRFYQLLEASAEEARESVRLLGELVKARGRGQNLEEFILARRKEKQITGQIREELVKTFVTGLEREDIEALATALYKIPKSVEKSAERYMLAADLLGGVDFGQQVRMMEKASELVVALVRQLRQIQDLEKVKELNDRLQFVEGEADKLMVEWLRDLYGGRRR